MITQGLVFIARWRHRNGKDADRDGAREAGGAVKRLRPRRSVLTCTIDGEVDQGRLVALREHLRLQRLGRLTDDWDAHFGYRTFEDGDCVVDVSLWRDDSGDVISWSVVVSADGMPAPALLTDLEREIRAAVTAAGLVVTGVVHHPDRFGPGSRDG